MITWGWEWGEPNRRTCPHLYQLRLVRSPLPDFAEDGPCEIDQLQSARASAPRTAALGRGAEAVFRRLNSAVTALLPVCTALALSLFLIFTSAFSSKQSLTSTHPEGAPFRSVPHLAVMERRWERAGLPPLTAQSARLAAVGR